MDAETKGDRKDQGWRFADYRRRSKEIFITCLTALEIPVGYQDDTGFHFGIQVENAEAKVAV
jgi:hypothetical protein